MAVLVATSVHSAVLIAMVALLANAFASPCGKERWAIKVGRDSGANGIALTAHRATVSDMRGWRAPKILGPARIPPHETEEYAMHANVVGYKLESDQDIHIVLADSAGATMIAEIPSPSCASGSPWQGRIAKARAAFLKRFRVSAKYQRASIPATVTGIGFFDFIHGQVGVAGNGVELHPVLGISFP